MRGLSISQWTVFRLGVLVLTMAPATLRADHPGDSFPAIPQPTFGPPADVAAANTPVRETVQRLLSLTEKTTDPIIRSELRLCAANVILSEQLEGFCTERFWRQANTAAPVQDDKTLRSAFDEVGSILTDVKTDLDVAREALAEAKPNGTEAESAAGAQSDEDQTGTAIKRYSNASRTRRTLLAFHQALQVALLPPDGEDKERARRLAASELSALMEHNDTRVATAANFWQSFLRRSESDATAALSRLNYALDDIPASARPYAFFSRVLRCLVLAEHDRRIAAMTLLTQMEERIFGWFGDESERTQAMRAVIWTRVNLLRQWHDSLDPASQVDERRWCRERAATLIETKLSQPITLPRLQPAIPVLFEPQKLEAEVAGSN